MLSRIPGLLGIASRKQLASEEPTPKTCLHLCDCTHDCLGVLVSVDVQRRFGIRSGISTESRSHFDDQLVFERWLAIMRCHDRVASVQRRQQRDFHPHIVCHFAMRECCEH